MKDIIRTKYVKVSAFLSMGGVLQIGDTVINSLPNDQPQEVSDYIVVSTPKTPNVSNMIGLQIGPAVAANVASGMVVSPAFQLEDWWLLVDLSSNPRQEHFDELLDRSRDLAAIDFVKDNPGVLYDDVNGKWVVSRTMYPEVTPRAPNEAFGEAPEVNLGNAQIVPSISNKL